MAIKDMARQVLPFAVKTELLRVKRLPRWIAERPTVAHEKAPCEEQQRYAHVLADRSSPLRRGAAGYDPRLQTGKERNVVLVASLLDGLLIPANRVFSYHHLVGRPSRLRGFRSGLELHDGRMSAGVGGGCCQVANLLYMLALEGGMKIVERHRHMLDLFPDEDRRVPFGCGATVFYNQADLRFENPLPQAVLLRTWVEQGVLRAQLGACAPVPWTVEVYEVDHRFFRENGDWYRENRIHRRFTLRDGTLLLDREEAHNLGRVLYEPDDAAPREFKDGVGRETQPQRHGEWERGRNGLDRGRRRERASKEPVR